MFDRIKRIFKKNKSNELGIVTLDNIVSVPNRKDLNDDKKSIEKIDKYKADYLKILTNKKTLTSHKLGEYNHISEKVRMYTDIYTSISLDEDELFEYTISNKDELVLRKVDIKNKLLKINLYLNDLEMLGKEIILHLIALKEIKNEKVFFSQNRKRILDEEINTLMISLINVISQKRAISIDTNTALKKHELLNILNEESSVEEEELINSNYECLKRLNSKLNINNNSNNNTNNKIILNAQMDKSIEEYAYSNKLNKDKLLIEILKEQLNNLKEKLSKSDNPESYMSLVKYYERKCIKYKKEGLITEDEMTQLYELKFYILTSNINSKNRINIREISTADEFEYYKKVMGNIIKMIFNNDNLNDKNKYYIFSLELCKKIHKSQNELRKEYVDYTGLKYYEILGNKEMLSFILGIYQTLGGFTDSRNTFINFCKTLPNTKADTTYYSHNCPEITFDKSTYKDRYTTYWLNSLNYSSSLVFDNKLENDFIYFLGYMSIEHLLPKDLIKIRKISNYLPNYYGRRTGTNRISYKLSVLIDEKNNIYDLFLPNSLKEINCPLFYERNYRKVVFNDGLEKINNIDLSYCTISELVLPSSITDLYIANKAGHQWKIGNIIINDFDKIDLNSNYIEDLIRLIFNFSYLNELKRGTKMVLYLVPQKLTINYKDKQIIIDKEDMPNEPIDLRKNNHENDIFKFLAKFLINIIEEKLEEQNNIKKLEMS